MRLCKFQLYWEQGDTATMQETIFLHSEARYDDKAYKALSI